MDIKSRLHHVRHIEVLRSMMPEQRLQKTFELSAMAKAFAKQQLRDSFPELSDEECHRLYLDQLLQKSQQKLAILARSKAAQH